MQIPNGIPVAAEALVRWRHPTKGLLRPAEFLPVLERSHDHARFLAWQLQRALSDRAMWGDRDLPICVNLAARCLLDRELPNQVAAALHAAGVNGDQLMLELTETAAAAGPVDEVLDELRGLGVRLAIDGFGTGHSSLTKLLQVPATDLKIAAEFVRDMLVSDQAAAICRLAVELGRSCGLHVTALGVTTAQHVTALTGLGCDAAQGRHLVPPLTPAALRDYLLDAPTKPAAPEADVIPLHARRRSSQP